MTREERTAIEAAREQLLRDARAAQNETRLIARNESTILKATQKGAR